MDQPRASQQLEAVASRRADATAAWKQTAAQSVVVASGTPIPIEGTDGFHPFRAHNSFRYFTAAAEPGCALVHDVPTGTWTLFVPPEDPVDAVWHGARPSLEDWAERTGIDDVRSREELGGVLATRQDVAVLGSHDLLERPGLYDVHPDRIASVGWDADATDACEAAHHAQRRMKDDVELRWMRAAADASEAGHEVGICNVRPGTTERDLAIQIEAAMFRAGAEGTAYESIVLGGTRASTLHGMPSSYAMTRDDVVLVDAGAEVAGYDSDITRTYPVGKRFTEAARAVYGVVLAAQEEAIRGCVPGAEFMDLHLHGHAHHRHRACGAGCASGAARTT